MVGWGGMVHGNWVVRRHVVHRGSRGRRLASTELRWLVIDLGLLFGLSGLGSMDGGVVLGRKVMSINIMDGRLGVGAVVSNGVMGDGLFVLLSERLEMKIAMLVVTRERLMIELMVLTVAGVTMDDRVMIDGRAVVNFSDSLMMGLLMHGPAVH